MTDLSPQAQEILEVMWFDHFETAADKRSLAASILREVINQLQQSSATHPAFISCPDLLKLCDELENL